MMKETATLGVAALRGSRFGNATTEETGAAAAAPAPAEIARTRGEGSYMAASLISAGLGGGLLGLVASSDWRGAGTGALFSVGAAGIADAFILRRSGAGLGSIVLSTAIGLGGLGGATWLAMTRK